MKRNYLILSLLFLGSMTIAKAGTTDYGVVETKSIQHNGHTREYKIYVPRANPKGIVITLHGIGQNMTDFFDVFDFRETANLLNYVLISPQALPEQDQSVVNDINKLEEAVGNTGMIPTRALWDCGLKATVTLSVDNEAFLPTVLAVLGLTNPVLDVVLNKNIDDVGFLDKIIRQTLNDFGMSNRNVFVSGTSMGGYMSYQYALTHSADIPLSGIIPIVGTHGREIAGEANAVKVPVCDFSSEMDEQVPYYNGWYDMTVLVHPLVGEVKARAQMAKPKQDIINLWVNKNRAVATPTVFTYPTSGPKSTTVTRYSYAATDGNNEVIHYKSDNTNHNYLFSKSNGDAMDYIEEIVKFIRSHDTTGSGIESLLAEKSIFYSNPVRDVIRFSSSDGTISIYDLTGKKILSETIKSGQTDISSLKTGIYLIRIQSEGITQTGKLIKQ